MSDVTIILLPDSVRAVLGEAASRDLVEVLNSVLGSGQDRVLDRMDQKFAALEARFDRAITAVEAKLNQANAALEARFDRTIAALEAKLDRAVTELRAEIDSKVSRTEARLIKWAFAFWASGVTALVVAILLK